MQYKVYARLLIEQTNLYKSIEMLYKYVQNTMIPWKNICPSLLIDIELSLPDQYMIIYSERVKYLDVWIYTNLPLTVNMQFASSYNHKTLLGRKVSY